MKHRIVTNRMKIKHRQNVELVNIAKKNHPTDEITVMIKVDLNVNVRL